MRAAEAPWAKFEQPGDSYHRTVGESAI